MRSENQKKRSIKDYLRIYGSGFIMGAADIVPGVSGGTMAFILGIYQELIESIRAFTTKEAFSMAFRFQLRKAFTTLPWPFLLALGLGILSAILLLSSHIKWMLENKPALIWAFFFGLVLASIITVFGRVAKWTIGCFAGAVAGGAAAWIIVGLPLSQNPPDGLWYIVLCGAIAICAMILPGISGSFILVLMGKYQTILNAVHEFKSAIRAMNWESLLAQLLLLGCFMVGIIVGISSFVRLLSWLFKKYHDLTVAILIGFMAGSLRKVWPWKGGNEIENILPPAFNREVLFAILLAAFGFVLVIVLERVAMKLEKRTQRNH